jgi:hypothetical protein
MDVKRAKVIAYNAIVMWREENLYDYEEEEWEEHLLEELGITREEYAEIMGEEYNG